MPLTIEKTFRFDAGHRCLGFASSKEETLHGHSWVLRLVIEATAPVDSYKTIFDTNQLARIVKPMIEQIDHSFIVWTEDPLYERLAEMCKFAKIDHKLYHVDFNPTVEGLVEHFFREIEQRLPLREAVLRRADLDASATLRASYSRDS
jgi:6-pyruvoyltetrahydropterin/6-carboxytetrahydropterin synthase